MGAYEIPAVSRRSFVTTAADLHTFIGRTGTLVTSAEYLRVPVAVLDSRVVFGRNPCARGGRGRDERWRGVGGQQPDRLRQGGARMNQRDRLDAHLAAVERSPAKVLALIEDEKWAAAHRAAERLHFHLRGLRAEVAR